MFFTVHDGTAAPAVGHRALIAPGFGPDAVAVLRLTVVGDQRPVRTSAPFANKHRAHDRTLVRGRSPAPVPRAVEGFSNGTS